MDMCAQIRSRAMTMQVVAAKNSAATVTKTMSYMGNLGR
jgi:hypothetical protein